VSVQKRGPGQRHRKQTIDRSQKVVHIAVEGNGTEPDYFRDLDRRLGHELRFKIHVHSRHNGYTRAVDAVAKVIAEGAKQPGTLWIAIDRDDRHTEGIVDLNAARRHAENGTVRILMSVPCFEAWLYMHFKQLSADQSIGTAKAMQRKLVAVGGAFATYGEGRDGKRLTPARLAELNVDGRVQHAADIARMLIKHCEGLDCDHPRAAGRPCSVEHRDPSSGIYELLEYIGVVKSHEDGRRGSRPSRNPGK